MTKFKNSLYYVLLYLLPKNCVSRLLGKLVSMRPPQWLARRVNRAFATIFKIDSAEAEKPMADYHNLQDFFIRRLKPGLRPIAHDARALVSPCDGFLSVGAMIDEDTLMQVKGKHYTVGNLLKNHAEAVFFGGGHYATLYLSPRDYHRFHSPVDGEIIETFYIPGTLWPVNRWAVSAIDELFCQNERVVTLIKERHTQKVLAHIAVGATVVGKIGLHYVDFNQYAKSKDSMVRIHHSLITIRKGEELGRFMFGSTIVLLFQPDMITSFAKEAPVHVKMGETLGNLHLKPVAT